MTKRIVGLVLMVGMVVGMGAAPARADWLASGPVTNPTLNQVLIDFVATTDQQPEFCADGSSTVAAVFRIQHRDTGNTTTLHEQFLPVAVSTLNRFCIVGQDSFVLLTNEHIRIIMQAAVLGSVSVSLHGNLF